MVNSVVSLHPVVQAFIAGIFTWGVTAAGAACVFSAQKTSQKVLDSMLGFAAGVMIAASFWSLLSPAITMSQGHCLAPWFPAAVGFLLGTLFVRLIDSILPHLHIGFPPGEAEGVKTSWKRSTLLIAAITLHNIPEGLAVGVAFGAAAAGYPEASIPAAVALALGIGIQNFPEGFAVSMPLRMEGMSRLKSFWCGQLSAVVEPIAAVIGAGAVIWAKPLLPYALAFAAGGKIFLVVEDVAPESQRRGNTGFATAQTAVGFLVMIIFQGALG